MATHHHHHHHRPPPPPSPRRLLRPVSVPAPPHPRRRPRPPLASLQPPPPPLPPLPGKRSSDPVEANRESAAAAAAVLEEETGAREEEEGYVANVGAGAYPAAGLPAHLRAGVGDPVFFLLAFVAVATSAAFTSMVAVAIPTMLLVSYTQDGLIMAVEKKIRRKVL
ncbi:Os12g0430500 [Oryza sativa Japonica Group]|uniref:Os12g0430500 protein n=1 Tax=Oryza sativa subsp. japonica TaxID=39947 RepID=C7J9L5_ORYSJ|nr:Os12g0430500 [Oryza sativa Japonica Group]|eukprot:NP_001176930.1 Os12g0430500 [Oryza sativa Japonica Group]